ncbi:hypothetical protein [Shouchella lonarensis]|nr:hypothetical protein [Shouchella lonarensis]
MKQKDKLKQKRRGYLKDVFKKRLEHWKKRRGHVYPRPQSYKVSA